MVSFVSSLILLLTLFDIETTLFLLCAGADSSVWCCIIDSDIFSYRNRNNQQSFKMKALTSDPQNISLDDLNLTPGTLLKYYISVLA